MNSPIQFRLAVLSARRTASVFIVLWSVVVLVIAANTHDEHAPHFGLAREHVWAAFLLAVVPVLVLRAAQKTAPMQSDDAAWLATKSTSNASIALATWLGAFAAFLLATSAFAVFSESGAPSDENLSIAAGSFEVPTGGWATTETPLRWNFALASVANVESGTFQVGIGESSGSASLISTRMRSAGGEWAIKRETHVGSRSELRVSFQSLAAGPHELELACPETGTSAVVLSPSGTLWKRTGSRFDAGLSIALRLLQGGATWLALALFCACFVGGTTAACTVLALWIPVWMSDWPASVTQWIPSADLFDALAIVAAGRAPAAPSWQAWIGTLGAVTITVAATAFALRRFRVSR